MPFDGQAQWQIDILAADKTAQAFASVDRRLDKTTKTLDTVTRTMRTQQDALAGGARKTAQSFDATAQSMEVFDKRVQRTIAALEFERQQLARTSQARERYAALRRAGVSETSNEGRAISASVAALQAQRAASEQVTKGTTLQMVTQRAAGTVWRGLVGALAPLAAAFSAVALATKVWDTAMEVADFGEKADQIGVTVKAMQALQFAGVQNGLAAEQLEGAIGKFSQKIGEAADGSKEMIESLDRLGVKVLDVQGNLRPTEDLLFEVAKKIMAIDDPARRAAAAVDFFGKTGMKLLPLLAQMAEGQDVVTRSAQEAGAMIGDDVVAKLDKFADRLARAKLTSRAAFADIAAWAIDAADSIEKALDLAAPDAASMQKRRDAWQRPIEDFFDWMGDSFRTIIAKTVGWAAGITEGFSVLGDTLPDIFKTAMDSAIEKVEAGVNTIRRGLARAQSWFKTATPVEDVSFGRLGGGGVVTSESVRARVEAAQAKAEQGFLAGMPNAADARARERLNEAQARAQADDEAARRGQLPAVGTAAGGASNPTPKGSGSDPYAKAIESAKEYILSKKAETAAIGETVLVAARLKHEQDLLNKATGDGKILSDGQKQALKDLAGAMAEADNAFATAKYMDDLKTKSEEFVQQQQIEMQSIGLSAEATARLRYEQQMLNDAKRQGIELSGADIETIRRQAQEMAAIEEQVRQQREMYEFARDTFKDFFTSIRDDLKRGATVWEAFGNAGAAALDKIAAKLFDMAANKLVEQAFGGSGGSGGGGAAGGILNLFSGLFSGGGGGNAWSGLSASWGFAKGGAFSHGNVIPFATGGIVGAPTLFPMSGGRTGLMGEAGPEAIMPLRRMPGGGLGVAASVDGGGVAPVVNVYQTVHVGEFVTTTEYARGLAGIRESAIEGAKAGVLADRKRGGASKQVFRR